jgi:uncharacterized protein
MVSKSTRGKSKPPSKGRSSSQLKKSERARKASSRREKPATKASKHDIFSILPVLTIWVIAVVILAGLIYWSRAPGKPPVASTTHKSSSNSLSSATSTSPPSKKQAVTSTTQFQSKPQAESLPLDGKKASQSSAVQKDTEKRPSAPDPRPSNSISAPKDVEKLASVSVPAALRKEMPKPPDILEPIPHIAEVAIVIDDFGQDLEIARKFLSIPLSITFSILPHQRYTKEIATLAAARGREVILHLPMEPQDYPRVNPGPGALFVSMPEATIQQTLNRALDNCPQISGVNNHMGSRFTENRDSMKVVLGELRRRNLYFLDSYTTDKSVGHALAQELNIPARRRDIFLDHTPKESFVRSQLKQLIRKAKVQGSAIAIGHPHELTYKVLSQEAERFRKEGIVVVPSGKLIRAAEKRE